MVKHITAVLTIAFVMLHCSSPQNLLQETRKNDGKYDSEFPFASISKDIDRIASSMKMLNCIAFYMTYFFEEGNELTRDNCVNKNLDSLAISTTVTNESVTGTATVLYYEPRLVGLLTCAHVVDFPDTLETMYEDGIKGMRSLSVKIKQQNFIAGLPDGAPVQVVAMDTKKDVAILSKALEPHEEALDVMDYPRGKARDMDWGTIVYTIGYPLGNLMVTQAIVSNPDKTHSGFFITDALYNQGISGGAVFALRDGAVNMEWVGMASAASASMNYVLEPRSSDAESKIMGEVYHGEILIDKKKSINYGISYSVSIEEILTFIAKNEKRVSSAGFDVDYFFQGR